MRNTENFKVSKNLGFVYIFKKIEFHPIFQSAEHYRFFTWLIFNAAWGSYTEIKDGKSYQLHSGELLISRKELSEKLNLSPRMITNYLKELVEKYDVIIKINKGKKYLIIIKNYDKYQKKWRN